MSEENTNEVIADTSVTSENTSNQNESNTKAETPSLAELQAQIQNLTVSNAKLKRANDKLASENGDLNKKYREKLSDEEKRNLEMAEAETLRAEKDAEKDELIRQLQKEKAVSVAEKSYLAMGWTKDEASRMANADAENDFDARMKVMAEVQERQRKEFDVKALQSRPPVNAGTGASENITKEQFDRMGYKEMLALKQSNPELFEKYSK